MASSSDRIARIARLEEMKAAIAAEQAAEIRAFAREHVESQIAAGDIDPEALERSIAAQVGLACRVSPFEGRKRLRIARDLHDGHTHVQELFASGVLSEYKTALVVGATSHLSREERASVDERLAAHRLDTLSVRRIESLAKMLAAEVAPEKFAARCRAARSGRRVTIRPAADGMANVTAHLPVEQAVASYAALVKAVNDAAISPDPVIRTRGQIMADSFVERITGQAIATDVNIEVQVLVPLEALLDPTSPIPAEIPGYGPIDLDLIATSTGRTTLRRLLTRDGVIIGDDSRQRTFTGNLARFLRARDGNRCCEPYCDAPVRHIDHIRRWADGGKTTFDNGRGLCEYHNHVREGRDWNVRRKGNTITTTTPTGMNYRYVIGTTARKASTQRKRRHAD